MIQDQTLADVNEVPVNTARGGRMQVYASPKTVGTTKLIMGSTVLAPGEEVREHLHDYGEEVVLVVRGQGTLHLDGETTRIAKDMLFVAKQGQPHRIVNDGSEELELIFATAPLAPTAASGHREV